MRWLIVGIAVLTFAIAGAGCGGGDDEASSTDTTSITETTDTDETTIEETDTEATDTEATDTDFSGDLSGECLEAVQAYSAALGAASSGGSSDDTLEAFEAFADQAPEEIRGDFQVLAQAYTKYIDEIGDLGLQPGETPGAEDIAKLSQAAAAFNDPEVTAANERVSAWAQENC